MTRTAITTTRDLSRFATCGALLAVSALLAGCASTHGGSAGSGLAPRRAIAPATDRAARDTTVVKAPTGSPRGLPAGASIAHASRPVSLATAETFAHAVNLTAADVPGAVARQRESHGERQREKRALAKCFGVQPAHEVLDVKSPALDRGRGIEGESFTSSVTVVEHPLEAEREIDAVQRFAGRPCLAHILRRSLLRDSHGRTRLQALRISPLHTQVVDTTASTGLRIEATFRTARGTPVAFYTDELAFAVGSAEVALGAFSVAQPIAPSVEQQLLSLLAQRARAHPL
jgi:hypothetical protein